MTSIRDRFARHLPLRLYLEIRWWNYRLSDNETYRFLQNERVSTSEDGYSYQPFDETKSIFVHIPKCAGVSVNKILYGNLAGGHTTFEKYLNTFSPREVVEYFKFTFVRNPWDRLVSAYHFLSKGGFTENNRLWFEKELGRYSDFEDFVKNWLNRENIWKFHHFRPQYHYMLDRRRRVHLDFVGFLENIEEDFSYIAQRLGRDVRLPHSNKSSHRDYMAYYDDDMRRIVAEVYAEDIDMLGYSFDNANIDRQLADRANGKKFTLSS